MVRTDTVKLGKLTALAYRQKLTAGGAGLAIITPNDRAAYTINKRDGSIVPFGPVNTDVFTNAVVAEAFELTKGLPYKKLGTVTKVYADSRCEEAADEADSADDKPAIDVVTSKEYEGFIMEYTDKNGKFSYQVMNRDLMKFADGSSVVSTMVADGKSDDEIALYVIRSKAVNLAGTKAISDDFLTAFADTFDSMNTRSAFKELKAHIRTKKSKAKR